MAVRDTARFPFWTLRFHVRFCGASADLCVGIWTKGASFQRPGDSLGAGGSIPFIDQLSSPRRPGFYKLEQVNLIENSCPRRPAHPVDDLFPERARPKQRKGYPRHAARLDQV